MVKQSKRRRGRASPDPRRVQRFGRLLWPFSIAGLLLSLSPASAGEWTGPYAGVSLGYAAGDDEAQEVNGPRNYIADFGGVTASAHLGWQRQFQSLVAGVEIEGGYLNVSSDVTRDVTGGFITSGADLGAYAALSGRLGLIINSDWLLYGRAGLAYAQLDGKTLQTCTDASLCGGVQTTSVSRAETQDTSFGLVLGAGIERQVVASWTGRIDYQFINFRDELALPPIDGPGWTHEVDVHAIKFGLSRRF
jgi:opacity protein-like surface antigen